MVGFFVSSNDSNYRFNRLTQLIGGLIAIGLGLTCVFSLYEDYITPEGLSKASLITYQSLSRPAWSVAVGWLLLVCSTKQGGLINRILSSPLWSPLARLNYAAYLIHSVIIFTTLFNRSNPVYYQSTIFINSYVSTLFFTYVAAIVVAILFETPFFIIEKKIFKR